MRRRAVPSLAVVVIGLLHPGAMGAQLGRTARPQVVWASEGRSTATHARAADVGLEDVGTVTEVCRTADVVVSICPPSAAPQVAHAVASTGFGGVYVDANAVSPATSVAMGDLFARFVDGSVIGPPPTAPGTTRLYLAGADAATVASLWDGSDLEAVVVDQPVGAASALKMAYAGWTKGSAALLLAVAGYAEAAGVTDELANEWNQSIPGLGARLERTASGTGPKAWRFTGEMEQIAEALATEGLPPGFHEAAAVIYARMADLAESEHPDLSAAIRAILDD